MKHYNLDKIEPIMRDCDKFFKDLIFSYRVQGVKIPERLKKLKESVENQIIKIEGEESGK